MLKPCAPAVVNICDDDFDDFDIPFRSPPPRHSQICRQTESHEMGSDEVITRGWNGANHSRSTISTSPLKSSVERAAINTELKPQSSFKPPTVPKEPAKFDSVASTMGSPPAASAGDPESKSRTKLSLILQTRCHQKY
ncbi:hypothetical protein B566_EDAN002542 [Ephemera danica]|nr:hypothetical protein B566_EDAN002542 [Ephemera danica]